MNYEYQARFWAETYGIINYKVKGNKMIYNKSYRAYLSNPAYTVQHTVNLDTMKEEPTRILKRVVKDGFQNT